MKFYLIQLFHLFCNFRYLKLNLSRDGNTTAVTASGRILFLKISSEIPNVALRVLSKVLNFDWRYLPLVIFHVTFPRAFLELSAGVLLEKISGMNYLNLFFFFFYAQPCKKRFNLSFVFVKSLLLFCCHATLTFSIFLK